MQQNTCIMLFCIKTEMQSLMKLPKIKSIRTLKALLYIIYQRVIIYLFIIVQTFLNMIALFSQVAFQWGPV